MIAELISKLTRRKAEATQAATTAWQTLVAEFLDGGDKTDIDGILSELEQLGRTLEDLEGAAELLTKRRAWAEAVAEGTKAEASYPMLVRESENSVRVLEQLIEKHHSRYSPLGDKLRAARDAMSAGGEARRQLIDTAGGEARQAALGGVDAESAALTIERAELRKRIGDREAWITRMTDQGKAAPESAIAMMPDQRAGLAEMLARDEEIGARFSELNDEWTRATAALLVAESI